MKSLKNRKNAVGVDITDVNRPDRIDEVIVDTEYYYTWDIPGTMSGGAFREDIHAKMLILHVKKVGTIFNYTAIFDKWTNRTTATEVPWSQRNNIIE